MTEFFFDSTPYLCVRTLVIHLTYPSVCRPSDV